MCSIESLILRRPQRLKTRLPTPDAQRSACGLHDLPRELLDEVMKHLLDIAALSKLFTALTQEPPAHSISTRRYYVCNEFSTSVAAKPTNIARALIRVLTVRSRPPTPPSNINHQIHKTRYRRQCLRRSAPRSVSTRSLRFWELIAVSRSLEALTEYLCLPAIVCLVPV